jgi:hypothetical protein
MNFKPLLPEHYPELKPYFKNLRYPLCEYSLPSIIAWQNQEYQPYGAIHDDTLIVRVQFTTKRDRDHLQLPVSPTKEYAPQELHDLAEKLKVRAFWYVPEEYILKYGRSDIESLFAVSEQTEYHDYVYMAEDLATLRGRKYSKKRNLINQFKRTYVRNGTVTEEKMTPSARAECLSFLDRWCEDQQCDLDEDVNLACEKEALINTIEHMDLLEVNGLILRIDGEISAFGMASHLTVEMGVLYFEKALTQVKGLYQYFDSLCAKALLNGYKYINKESDMDLPGLAKAKKSYHPVFMVKSFKLELK